MEAGPLLAAAGGTRARLLEAAHDVTAESGYGAASVTAIAARAGVATGTLYRHFPSKGHLFVDLFRRVCGGEIAAMQQAADRPGATAGERIEEVLATFAARALQNPRLAWALLAEPLDPLVEAERLAYRRTYRTLLAQLLRQAIDGGEIPDQDVEFTAAAVVGGVGEALVGPLSPLSGDAPPVADLLASLRRFVRGAIGAPPRPESDQEHR
ncbi:TetR/AcrR family transcriptional regulator [Patulibacter defluvii]|uniref:TetR/AcrR family transcriptional regulator n=1 Tax=Patulibacter defluvii TaxID=3095358 RepID=UPI002A758AB3|nr:TetR/AcrR family transcriptional regulator [Patulibacter sp. DM4]